MRLEDIAELTDSGELKGKFKQVLDFVKSEVEEKGAEAVAEEIRKFQENSND